MVSSFASAMVAPTNISTSASSSILGRKSSLVVTGFCGLSVFVVDHRPLQFWFICPFAVAVDLGKYFLTSFDVMCGKPIN
jgi:hypothetical protein